MKIVDKHLNCADNKIQIFQSYQYSTKNMMSRGEEIKQLSSKLPTLSLMLLVRFCLLHNDVNQNLARVQDKHWIDRIIKPKAKF